jgi:amidase
VRGQSFPSLINATIDDLSAGLESGLFTSAELVSTYFARIREVNSLLNVVTEVNPDALSIADDLDSQRAKGRIIGPLHGIPVLIKDNIATGDKMNNTAGSWALVGAKVPSDSFMAKKLRAAGAIILGKANLSQWANYRSSNSSNGWSAYGGQVYGAYYPKMDPSGSSSGSGVSTSLGLSSGVLGTEVPSMKQIPICFCLGLLIRIRTSGSILSPSQRNNLVGIKPTVGLTSRYLVIPISEHQDTIGPMTRTVKDAAIILSAIAGVDPKDNYTFAIPHSGKIPNYVTACRPGALQGARIGIPYNILTTEAGPELSAFNSAVNLMKSSGAIIIDANFTVPSPNTSSIVLEADFVSNLATYLSELTYNPHNINSLSQLRQFTYNDTLEQYPDRNMARWDSAVANGLNNTDGRAWAALQDNYYYGGEGGLLGTIRRNNLDAVILPTSQSAGRAAIVGAPVITVPLGFYPPETTVLTNVRGLVTRGPNVP